MILQPVEIFVSTLMVFGATGDPAIKLPIDISEHSPRRILSPHSSVPESYHFAATTGLARADRKIQLATTFEDMRKVWLVDRKIT